MYKSLKAKVSGSFNPSFKSYLEMLLDERGEMFDCECEGRNPECQKCSGKGYYYKTVDLEIPRKKISNPDDPFPLIPNDTYKNDNEEVQWEKHLQQYARAITRKRKRRETREEELRQKRLDAKVEELRKDIERIEEEKRKNREILEDIKKKKRKRIDKK